LIFVFHPDDETIGCGRGVVIGAGSVVARDIKIKDICTENSEEFLRKF
jgi:hypothetical protein